MVLDCPSQTPVLNQIEHAFYLLKKRKKRKKRELKAKKAHKKQGMKDATGF